MRSGETFAGVPGQPAPIVLSLLAWSRRFIAVFFTVAVFALGWSLSWFQASSGRVSLDVGPAWQLGLMAACATAVFLSVGLRRLARSIDRQVRYLGALDALTGLSNRTGVMERLLRPEIAVLYLDLDRFKGINDTLGHDMGDEVLKTVAQRIRRIVRPSDLAARLGGDEFVVVVEGKDAAGVARDLADRVRTAVAQPLKLERRELRLSCSIGVAVKSPGLASPSELLRAADLALYRAKREGRDRAVFFSEQSEFNVLHRLDLESDLWKAMEREQLELHYLPEVNLQSGAVAGLEALVRWRHPEHGLMRPDSFLALAEETGSVNEMGLWAVERACQDWGSWQAGRSEVRAGLSVNFSLRQLAQPDLLRRLEQTLREYDLDPRLLSVEVRERILIDGGVAPVARLADLRRLGLRIVVDDFGTGHAPLSALRRWQVSAVKMDRTLVNNLEFDDSKLLIVQAIISLAHDLGMEVTGAGIETPRQLSELHDLGCDFGQGYYLSEPLPTEGVRELLSRRQRRAPRRARAA